MACDPCKQIIVLRTYLQKLNKTETIYEETGTKPMTQ